MQRSQGDCDLATPSHLQVSHARLPQLSADGQHRSIPVLMPSATHLPRTHASHKCLLPDALDLIQALQVNSQMLMEPMYGSKLRSAMTAFRHRQQLQLD